MASQNHIHTYVKYKKKPGYYRCAAPDCTHYTDKESVRGKQSRCNLCGEVFILTAEDLQRVRPRCVKCSDTSEAAKLKRVTGVVEDIFKNIDFGIDDPKEKL